MDEQKASEEQKPIDPAHPRERLWRAAMIAGFMQQDHVMNCLRNLKRPWFEELAPLTPEERAYIVWQLCKAWYPSVDDEQHKQSFKILWRLFGGRRARAGLNKESANGPH